MNEALNLSTARASGLLLPVTSLPGPNGIGTLGKAAYHFVDLLREGGQSVWQILPIHPVSALFGYSPYSALSSFAGNPLIIDLEQLQKEPWMKDDLLSGFPGSEQRDFIEYEAVVSLKMPFLRKAFENFQANAADDEKKYFNYFCKDQREWLDDYALYMTLAARYSRFNWVSWDEEVRTRKPRALKAAREKHATEMDFYRFEQFVFLKQWHALKSYANKNDIRLMGDVPIYVNFDSVDTWSNQAIFQLDRKTLRPVSVAGVPPDYFSRQGQRWGNPLYRWYDGRKLREDTLMWWQRRLGHMKRFVDIVRLDHFRGFESYWAIPAGEKTAVKGKWMPGPGREFFLALEKKHPDLQLIAEDLGDITPEVTRMREDLGMPGMKVLQFAFDGKPDNPHLPHNFRSARWVLYTGTHDNNTSNGWFYGGEIDEKTANYALNYMGAQDTEEFHWKFIRLALASIAGLVVIPVQDVLGYGEEFRLNTPGSPAGNWRWKLRPQQLTVRIMKRLRELVQLYGRS